MAFNAFTSGTKIESAKMNENFSNIADGSEVNNVAWSAWTPTVTGFSGSPTATGTWTQIGKIVFLQGLVTGTSDATSLTITNLPVAPKTAYYGVSGVTQDGGTYGVNTGHFYIAASATTITFYKDNASSSTGWTASGTKTVAFNMVYEVN